MMKHKEFILTPLVSLIEKTLLPLDMYKGQMSSYAIKEYVLQTLLFKLTGCMEQKAKCILWDIATHDFEFRRVFLEDKQRKYSKYDERIEVYITLLQQVGKIKETRKNDLLTQLKVFKEEVLEKSINKMGLPRDLHDLEIKNLFDIKRWAVNCLFDNSLHEIYKQLYNHRNRCAHNVLSYQGNAMPPQKIKDLGGYNYASWFTLLVLMDMIYMELYTEFTLKRY